MRPASRTGRSSRVSRGDPRAGAHPGCALSGLRGKDVLLVFVESYGRVRGRGLRRFSPGVDRRLDGGTAQLDASDSPARSALASSPTFGGISWLAHSTLQSGCGWTASSATTRCWPATAHPRLVLRPSRLAHGRDVPANQHDWPEASTFYHYDQVYDAHNVGYPGPAFGFGAVPDQYTLARSTAGAGPAGRAPVMAEIDLLTSHTPWMPLPQLVAWTRSATAACSRACPSSRPR